MADKVEGLHHGDRKLIILSLSVGVVASLLSMFSIMMIVANANSDQNRFENLQTISSLPETGDSKSVVETPKLYVPSQFLADQRSKVRLPINYEPKGNNIIAMQFALNFDDNIFSGKPAVEYTLPAGVSGTHLYTGDPASELLVVIFGKANTTLGYITLDTPAVSEDTEFKVAFGENNYETIFVGENNESVPGNIVGGSILVKSKLIGGCGTIDTNGNSIVDVQEVYAITDKFAQKCEPSSLKETKCSVLNAISSDNLINIQDVAFYSNQVNKTCNANFGDTVKK